MKSLSSLRRFIMTRNTEEDREEVRMYLTENAEELASAFGVSRSAFVAAIERVQDDTELALRVLDGIRRAGSVERTERYEGRVRYAQQSAEILGAVTHWRPYGCEVDVPSLLKTCLTRRKDLLVFTSHLFAVSIRMAPLFDLARLRLADLTGWVDAKGFHVRWASGGLNFFPASDPHASRIIVPLAGRARIAS